MEKQTVASSTILCYANSHTVIPLALSRTRSWSMASVMTNLDTIVQKYLQDSEFQQARQVIAEKRRASIPHYKGVVNHFIDGTYTLHVFRNALITLHQDTFWGAFGPGFLKDLHQLA